MIKGEPPMGILRHLQHWVMGRGPHLQTAEFVPETHPIRQWADTFPWDAMVHACVLREVKADRAQAHFVLPETLAQFRRRLDQDLMDDLVAIQAAVAMEEGLVSPAHLLVDTFPSEQGSQRVTDATTLYKAQKKSYDSSSRSRAKARHQPRP